MTKSTKKTAAKAAGNSKSTAKKGTAVKKPIAGSKKTTAKAAVKKKVAKKKTAATKKAPVAAKSGSTKTSIRKKAAANTTAKRPANVISGAQRHAMIAEAAYLHAEAHGFTTDSNTDWVRAESEIDTRLARDGILVKD